MSAQALRRVGKLGSRHGRHVRAQMPGLEPADGEFAPDDRPQQIEVLSVEQVESPIAAIAFAHRLRALLQGLQPRLRVLDRGHEFEVPVRGGAHEAPQGGQAVDGLADGGQRELARPVPMFHLAVVLEKRHVAGRALDPADEPCPRCGGRLRVIATVQDPLAVQAILAQLARSGAPAPPGPAPPPPAAMT